MRKIVALFSTLFLLVTLPFLVSAQSSDVCWDEPLPSGITITENSYSITQASLITGQNVIDNSNGYVEFDLASALTNDIFWVGLSENTSATSWKDFVYAIGIDAYGSPSTKHAYNNGNWKAGFSVVNGGDKLRIEIVNGQVIFSMNDSPFHTQNAIHTGNLQIMVYFNHVGQNYTSTIDFKASGVCEGNPPEPLVAALSKTNAAPNQDDGTVTATISNGNPPYDVAFSNGANFTNSNETVFHINNLAPDTYSVTITDDADQTITPPAVVVERENADLNAFLTKTDADTGQGNGTITATITSGNPPYNFFWSNGEQLTNTNENNHTISDLVPATYRITITDNANQTITPPEVIIEERQPDALEATLTKTDASSEQNDGTVTATIGSGTPPFSLTWSNGTTVNNSNQTVHQIIGLSPGTYSVTITDNNQQSLTPPSITVEGPPPMDLAVSLSKTDVSAPNQNDGTVTATITSGTPPFSVSWSNGVQVNNSSQTVHIINNLPAGMYSVTVSDSNQQTESPPAIMVESPATPDCGTLALTDCSDHLTNNNSNNLGEPEAINLPLDKGGVYSGSRSVPTFRQMLGTNFILTNTFDYPNMPNLTDIFSYPRIFLFHNKDYWDDGIGEPTTENKKRIIRPREIERLKILVDANNKPFLRGSFQPGDKIISIDPNTGNFKTTPITPQNISNFSAGQQNTYTGYMNSNYRFVQEHFNKYKSEANNNPKHPFDFKGLVVTLTVVNANFPSNIAAEYNFPANWWKKEDWGFTPTQIKCSAKAYAKIFARTYAPTAADCSTCERLVDVLEIGNEPWAYDAETYQAIAEGFMEGIVEYYQDDPSNKIHLLPAAFQAQHLENNVPANAGSAASWKDYLGTRLNPNYKCHLNGINLHPYSNQLSDVNNPNSFYTQRLLAYPEMVKPDGTADSKFLYTRNAWQWVEDNMPVNSQNIFITEFGWDSANNDCGDGSRVGVGEITQGLYIVRSLLNMSRMGVYRATLFEASDDPHLNNGCQFAYHSSGIWNKNPNQGGTPKLSKKILHKFIELTGKNSFNRLISENDDGAYAYILDENGVASHLVAWYATNINNDSWTQIMNKTFAATLNLTVNNKPYQVDFSKDWYYLDDQIATGANNEITNIFPLTDNEKNQVFNNGNFVLRPVPIYIPIIQTGECTDTQAPQLICPTDITKTQEDELTVVTWNEPTISDDCDQNPVVNGSHTSGDEFPVGSTTVTYTAEDQSGKISSCSFVVTIEEDTCQDNAAPQVSCPDDISKIQEGELTPVSWDMATVTDDCDQAPTLIASHNSGDEFPVGETIITYTATDESGKSATCTFTITIQSDECQDNNAPQIFCPDDISKIQEGELTTVNWDMATANDDCDQNPSLSSTHTSGDQFPVGETIVTYTATDASGKSATCTFTITIQSNECQDNSAPQVFCPDNISKTQEGELTTVNWDMATVTDDCDQNPNLSATHTSGDQFPVGETIVTYTATDESGKSATCTFTVTIESSACQDDIAPQMICPEDISKTEEEGGTVVTWEEPIVSDDCDENPTLTATHNSGDSFPTGTTTVTYTATDESGKSNSCSFTITIEEANQPVEFCQSRGQQPWERWIERVVLKDIDNQSWKQASTPVGYGDFTTLSTSLTKGQTYVLELFPGSSWAADPNHNFHWRVWIDFNQDGDFEDEGEALIQVQSNVTVNANFGLRSDAKLGTTRMRVSMKNGGFPRPCELIEKGEVEDYTIEIIE